MASARSVEHTDHWCDLLDLSLEQHHAIRFYTALFCVDFMSELRQCFSHGANSLDEAYLGRLETLLDDTLNDID